MITKEEMKSLANEHYCDGLDDQLEKFIIFKPGRGLGLDSPISFSTTKACRYNIGIEHAIAQYQFICYFTMLLSPGKVLYVPCWAHCRLTMNKLKAP